MGKGREKTYKSQGFVCFFSLGCEHIYVKRIAAYCENTNQPNFSLSLNRASANHVKARPLQQLTYSDFQVLTHFQFYFTGFPEKPVIKWYTNC